MIHSDVAQRAEDCPSPYDVAVKRPALLLAGALVVTGCSGSDTPVPQVAEVVRADVHEVVDAPGTVQARASSTVSAPADGTVADLAVQDGARVEEGDVLVRIDSPAAQARLEQARSARASAATRVTLPRADLGPLQAELDASAHDAFDAARDVADELPEGKGREAALARIAAAEARYNASASAARTAVRSVSAGVGGVEQALNAVSTSSRAQAAAVEAAAQSTVDALTVRAPQDGVVTFGTTGGSGGGAGQLGSLLDQLPGAAGQGGGAPPAPGAGGQTTEAGLAVGVPVTSGSPLLTVTDVSELTVVADVDETDVLLVDKGVPADVEIDAVPGATYTGTVRSVDVTPSQNAGGGVTYRVRTSLQRGTTPDGRKSPRPRPGMSAVVDLRVREAQQAVSVPTSALVRDGDREVVFVQADGAYRRREITVGAHGEDRVQVVRGVDVGEKVVVRDADRVRDGQPVPT